MSGRFFCMFCGSANFASPYAHSFECKQCNQIVELPHNQSTNQSVASSVVSSPSTPSCSSTISSRCSSATENDMLSPVSSIVPDLHLESSSASEDETDDPTMPGSINQSANPVIKKRRRSSGKKRDPRAPKRAANAYMLFCKSHRPILRAQQPDLPFSLIGQTLGEMWRQMTIEQRKPYEGRAAKDRERYRLEMHMYTASTLRNSSVIGPLMNHSISRLTFPDINPTVNQAINQPVDSELFLAMTHNLTQPQSSQWADQSTNRSSNQSMIPPMMSNIDPSTHQPINRTIKQQNIPLMVQQAQQQYHQMKQPRYHPYSRPFKQSADQMNNQLNHQAGNWQQNNQTLSVEPSNQPINQSNNQFHYGPVKPDRRFSYQSISSINQFTNQANNHGLIPTQVNDYSNTYPVNQSMTMNQSMNQSMNQVNIRNPFVFENFSSLEQPQMTQSINNLISQPINQFDFPNDSLDLESANFGLWEPTFDEI